MYGIYHYRRVRPVDAPAEMVGFERQMCWAGTGDGKCDALWAVFEVGCGPPVT